MDGLPRHLDDPAFWRALCPRLHLDESAPLVARHTHELTRREVADQRTLLREDGYFDIPGVLDAAHVDPMADCVRHLSRLSVPVIFSLVYDEFWTLVLEVTPILARLLGEPFVLLPEVWTYYVDHRHPGNFAPHRDGPFERCFGPEGTPTVLNVWVPLTDVTTDDSCMYVVAKSFDVRVEPPRRRTRAGRRAWKFPLKDLVHVRALPARKGSLLGWNLHLLHWAAPPKRRASHRISVGYFVQAKSVEPLTTPVVDFGRPLPLTTRLGLIGKQFYRYSPDRRPASMRMARALMRYLPNTATT